MKKSKFLIIFIFISLFNFCGELSEKVDRSSKGVSIGENDLQSLYYLISYKEDPEPHLVIRLQFKGDESGKTRLIVPHEWAWQDSFEKGIKNLKLLSPHVQTVKADNGIDYEITYPASKNIEIQYEVKPYWDGPINREVYYRPIIKLGYFHFIGHGVFVFPDWDSSVSREIQVEWKGVPDDWEIANSFGVNKRQQLLKHSIKELCHAVYMAGGFSIRETEIKGYPVYVAIRGEWKFPMNEFVQMIKKIAIAEREFWNDYDFPYFLISMIPIDGQNSKGGTGLTNSFALFVSDDLKKVDDLRFLLTHELFHTWNGRKIQREEPEELIYWFSEGFTDFYTRLILLRSGLITLKEFIANYNRVLMEYFCSPAINVTNEEILRLSHKDSNIERIPYLRGDILAFRWNALIKQTSGNSLDDLMFDLFQEAQTNGIKVSIDNLAVLMKKLVPQGIEQDMEQYIVKGNMLNPGKNDLGPGAVLIDVDVYRFDLGFTFKESDVTNNWLVTDVNQDGPAWQGGLRKGYTIIGRSIHWGQSNQPIILVFLNDQGEKTRIEYLPQGEKKTVPQYRLNEEFYQENRIECLKWFGVNNTSDE